MSLKTWSAKGVLMKAENDSIVLRACIYLKTKPQRVLKQGEPHQIWK